MQGTLAEIERRGWHLKSWTAQTGRFRPGGPFTPNSLRRLLTNILYTGAIGIKGRITRGTHGHSRSGQLGAEPDHASRGVCARTDAHQTSRAAERTSLLRMLRGADGVLVFGEEGAQVHVLCMAQRRGRTVCPAKSLPARSIEDSVLSRIWEAGPLRNRRMGTTGTCQAGRGGWSRASAKKALPGR